jgi:beta-lactamase class A
MITIPTLHTPHFATTNQQQVLSSDKAADLGEGQASDAYRAPLLKQYISRIINKNEKQKVTTDVSVIDLQTGKLLIGHNVHAEQFAASVNKVPIAELVLADVRAGKLTMDSNLRWTADDVRAGAGVYDQAGAPTVATVRQLLFDMLNPSGNTAVRVLVNNALGGAVHTNTRIAGQLKLKHTYLQPLDANRFYLGNSTAYDSSKSLQRLLAKQDTPGRFVKNALSTNIYTNYGVRSQLAGNDYIVLANKVGILDDVDGNNRHDVGIIYNTKSHKSYAYSFMNTAHGAAYEAPTSQAGASLADMGNGMLRYAGDKVTESSRSFGAQQQPTPEKKILY